ncbi:MAG: metallophosphoesterase family protein [bacterium]|nr:metallophosphoesterase family protein [bacterium]
MTESLDKDNTVIGVISDTHGLLRPKVYTAFKDVDLIVHAGDFDTPEIFATLQEIAPVIPVRGNMDRGRWAKKLPVTETVELGKISMYILHNFYGLDLAPEAAGFSAVIYGHTHQPSVKKQNGVLFLNPGSAGPRRYDYPVSVALLHVRGTVLEAEIIDLET